MEIESMLIILRCPCCNGANFTREGDGFRCVKCGTVETPENLCATAADVASAVAEKDEDGDVTLTAKNAEGEELFTLSEPQAFAIQKALDTCYNKQDLVAHLASLVEYGEMEEIVLEDNNAINAALQKYEELLTEHDSFSGTDGIWSYKDCLEEAVKVTAEIQKYNPDNWDSRIPALLLRGWLTGRVQIVDCDPLLGGVCCQIGEHAFTFGSDDAEQYSAKEYLAKYPVREILDQIEETLTVFEEDDSMRHEFLYCMFFLDETPEDAFPVDAFIDYSKAVYNYKPLTGEIVLREMRDTLRLIGEENKTSQTRREKIASIYSFTEAELYALCGV